MARAIPHLGHTILRKLLTLMEVPLLAQLPGVCVPDCGGLVGAARHQEGALAAPLQAEDGALVALQRPHQVPCTCMRLSALAGSTHGEPVGIGMVQPEQTINCQTTARRLAAPLQAEDWALVPLQRPHEVPCIDALLKVWPDLCRFEPPDNEKVLVRLHFRLKIGPLCPSSVLTKSPAQELCLSFVSSDT